MKVRITLAAMVDLEVNDILAGKMRHLMITPKERDGDEWAQVDRAIEMLAADLMDRLHPFLVGTAVEDWSAVCAGCGCTEDEACLEGCSWVEFDLCSVCAAGRKCKHCGEAIRFDRPTFPPIPGPARWVHTSSDGRFCSDSLMITRSAAADGYEATPDTGKDD